MAGSLGYKLGKFKELDSPKPGGVIIEKKAPKKESSLEELKRKGEERKNGN